MEFKCSFQVKVFFLVSVLAVALWGATSAKAAELIIFEQAYCDWCETWDDEVGKLYDVTVEGKLIPLRRVDIDNERPDDLLKIRNVNYTPTFVVLHEGQEIGRIVGYPGESNFYWLLGELIKKMKKDM